LQAQITDHVVEDNTMLQDHIALSPIKITLTGKVSELVLVRSKLQKYAETALNALSSVGVLSPALSVSASQALSKAIRDKEAVDKTIAKFNNLKEVVAGNTVKTKQQEYYLEIKQWFYGRGLFTVQTPWETLENMAIESVSFDQDETTVEWTTVTVTMKQITLAKTKQLTTEIKGRVKVQKTPIAEKGKVRGKSTGATLYDGIKNFFFGR
jgi:hypothetical protein